VLLSVITPTHHPTWLDEAYRSLLYQDFDSWEWVLAPNGIDSSIPRHIMEDPRVRVCEGAYSLHNIGAIKRYACDSSNGDAFIELDHDDALMPGSTLSTIAKHIADGAGFVYSDAAYFRHPGFGAHKLGEAHDWINYPIRVYGRQLNAHRCFPLTPRCLCEVYYAPDHVRVWSRDAYYNVGGHDKDMSVGDDHDLICRTYLGKHKFVHTGGCNYLYRLHQNNTYRARSNDLWKQVEKNRTKYAGPLMREWCRREGYMILDLALELQRLGATASDWLKWYATAYNDPVGLIVCNDILQFLPGDQVPRFMDEAYKKLVPGGYLEISVPSATTQAAFLYHGAKSYHTTASFFPYCNKDLCRNPRRKCRYQLVQGIERYPSKFHRQHNLRYATIQLVALKGQRHPGKQQI